MSIAPRRKRWFDMSPRATQGFIIVVVVLIVGVVAALAHATWTADLERASSDANNLAVTVEQDIHRNILLYDLSIQGARDAVMDEAVMAAPRALRDRVLFDRTASALYLGEMLVLGADGSMVASSRPYAQASSSVDRDYFRIHALMPDFGLFVSRPMTMHPGEDPVIALSRRITRPDGSFGGVIVGTMRVEYLRQLFQRMRSGQHGAFILYRGDGSIIMREPFVPAILGMRLMPQALSNLASSAEEGEYQASSPIDGEWRLQHFRRLHGLPLTVDVGLSLRDVHKRWWLSMALIGSVVGLCCGSIIFVTLRLGRELRRRIEAESALLGLVDTDGLTGLANRRCFDRVLAEAWQHAVNTNTPLGLMMIDADRFKAFNDTFGHAAGDEVLRKIGQGLAAQAHRPGHLSARFGGEEFAMVLPGLDGAAMLQLADAIRRSIEHLGIDHPAAPLGLVTVSIGCASSNDGGVDSGADLLMAADAALYRAKRAGRNTVRACPPEPNQILSLAS